MIEMPTRWTADMIYPRHTRTKLPSDDVSKDKLAVAAADAQHRDEGTFENTSVSVDKFLKKLSGRGDFSVCYWPDQQDTVSIGRCGPSATNAARSHHR